MSSERSFSLVCIVLSVLAIFSSDEYKTGEAVGPEWMPRIWAGLILVSCFVVLIKSDKSEIEHGTRFSFSAVVSFVFLLAYMSLVPVLGYFESTFLFLIGLIACLEAAELGISRSLRKGALVALAWCMFSFFVFVQGLDVQLPLSPWVESWIH